MGNEKKARKITVSDASEPRVSSASAKTASTKKIAEGPLEHTTGAKSSTSVAKVRPRTIMNYQPKKPRAKIKVDLKTAEIVEKPTPKKATAAPQPAASQETEPIPQKTRHILIKTRYAVIFVIVLLAGLFFGRVAIWEDQYLSAKEGSERSQVETSDETTSEGDVDTTEPSEIEIAEYHVSPHLPRYITIRSLGIYNSRVEQSGISANGEMAVPYNTWNTGWYINSDLPGKIGGTAVIDGHSGDAHCIFNNLPKIKPGAEITIEMGDEKTKYTYVVTSLVTKQIGDEANSYMDTALARKPGVAQLTLITCTGDWWQQSGTYSHRLFVHAVLKQ